MITKIDNYACDYINFLVPNPENAEKRLQKALEPESDYIVSLVSRTKGLSK
ncbi:hypothetical protein S7335_1011 [Synechococcus sp. PCC 7335]|nr:hypothetical protein S7335_1011 [Synechococcus sp. PCC 7335]